MDNSSDTSKSNSIKLLIFALIFIIYFGAKFFINNETEGLENNAASLIKQDNLSIEAKNKIQNQILSSLVKTIKDESYDYTKASTSNIKIKQIDDGVEARINIESIILFIPELDTQNYHDIAMNTFIDSGKKIFPEYQSIKYIRLVFCEDGYDSYGKKIVIENFIVGMNRKTFEKVNWDVVGDPFNIYCRNYDPNIFQELYERYE